MRHRSFPLCSGGAGNRTLVRVWFQNRIYVRRSLFQRLPDPAWDRPLRGLPPDVSPRASEDHAQPARICDPIHRAPGGLSEPEVRQASLAQLTQPAPGYRWRLVVSKRFSQGLGPGHAAIPSSNPSKPIAPGCVITIHTRGRSDKRRAYLAGRCTGYRSATTILTTSAPALSGRTTLW